MRSLTYTKHTMQLVQSDASRSSVVDEGLKFEPPEILEFQDELERSNRKQ